MGLRTGESSQASGEHAPLGRLHWQRLLACGPAVCPNVIVAELPPSPAVPGEIPPSWEGPEAVGRQRFIWALVAGFLPVCGLPVVWGFARLGWRKDVNPSARLWS